MDERQRHLSLGDERYERAPEPPARTSGHRRGGPVLVVGGLLLVWCAWLLDAELHPQLVPALHVLGVLAALAGLLLLLVNLDAVLRLVRERDRPGGPARVGRPTPSGP